MLRNYLPVLLLLGFVIINAVLILGIAHLTVRPQPTMVKSQPYESGMSPLGDARERFSVKFYLVAMLFIVFDIGGNKFRLITSIHYNRRKVYIRAVLTHAEYDRGNWKNRR